MPTRPLTDKVQEQLKRLPGSPGCYIYRDEQEKVLYVGKALSLKNRVRSYFQDSARHGARIERMVRKVRDIEWIVVDSEVEALVLECNLIKQHRPPYNVRMRDDKSYPYITITNEKFPRVMFTRKVRKDGSKYFGPYTSAFSVRDTLQLLHKIFPLIPCGKSWTGLEEQRPCLYYHLGRCLGPCAGLAQPSEYVDVLAKVERFLNGKEESLVEDLRKEMTAAADQLDFERAAKVRDQIAALENVLQRQKVLTGDKVDQDVIAVVKDDRGAAIQMLYIRGGKLIGQRQFMLDGAAEASPAMAVQEFVKQYYSDAPEVPREVLLPVEIEERGIVQAWLRQRKGSAVTLDVPQQGERARLVDMAAANAEQALSHFSDELQKRESWAEEAMTQLQEEIDLPGLPMRIEGYDISNIQGTAPVGSMVVVENGGPAKAEYRRFKIRYHPESPNDFAMMHEVITRRLRAYLDGDEKFSVLPDLIMIDGGKGQLSAALQARDELGLTVAMVGLAKRHELIYVPSVVRSEGPQGGGGRAEGGGDANTSPSDLEPRASNLGTPPPSDLGPPTLKPSDLGPRTSNLEPPPPSDLPPPTLKPSDLGPRTSNLPEYSYSRARIREYEFREVELPLQSPGLLLLRKLRDEAHRFALTYHRKLRDKRLSGSAIEEIPGVGPRRKRLLLRTFGSVEGIRRASVEEISAVPTMTKTLAAKIREYLEET